MPTNTMTDQEKIEVLATKGLGWTQHQATENHEAFVMQSPGPNVRVQMCVYRSNLVRDLGYLLTDLNAVAEIEARLTPKQSRLYGFKLYDLLKLWDVDEDEVDVVWAIRHASPRVCCEALVEVLKG